MTSSPKSSFIAAALTAAIVVALSTGMLRVQHTGSPTEPFWQLQGASPSIAPEADAIVQFRAAARHPQMLVAAR